MNDAKPTKKLYLQILKDKGVAMKFYPGPHLEDRPAYIADITQQLLTQGAKPEDIKVSDDFIEIGRQYWRLPKNPRKGDYVRVQIRSKDLITFRSDDSSNGCYSDIKDWQVVEYISGAYCLEHGISKARLYISQ
jgi:hypothetical protein